MSDLPPGFQLDEPPQGIVINMSNRPPAPGAGDLPPGFTLDEVPSAGRTAGRLTGQFAQNANDAIVNTISAPFDLAAAATNKLGLSSGPSPVGPALKSGVDYVATLPGRLRDVMANQSLSPLTESRTSRFDPETRGEKIAAGTGYGVGSALATMLPAGAIARAATPGTVTQGVAQTLASQPKTQLAAAAAGGGTTGATDNPWLGLAAGLATPLGVAGVRRAISPVTNQLSPQEGRIAQFAQQEGVPLTPAQATGSGVLRGLEETMARLPLASGPMQNTYAGQRAAFNRSTLSRAGVTADDASPETIQNAFQQAGQTFDDLAARTTVDLSGQNGVRFARQIGDTITDYGQRLPTDQAPVFASYMRDIAPLIAAIGTPGANQQIAGQIYQRIRSGLATRIRETQNGDLRRALGGVIDAFDNAMQGSATGRLADEWREARRQYQALMTVDKAMQGGTQADRSAGNIPFSGLKSATQQGDRAGFSRGRGQMNEPARLGDFLATRVPNSGTPERMMWANLLTGGSLFGGGMAAGGGPTLAGAMAGAASAAAPWAVSRAYNSPMIQRYLTNQMAGRSELGPLYAAQGLDRSIEIIPRDQPSALARALMKANEKRAAR